MTALLAVDDGLINGNYTFADIMFLVGMILFIIAAVLLHPRPSTSTAYPVSGWSAVALGLACVSLGWLVL